MFIGRLDDAVMNPFALASSGDYACLSQISQVPRNLWLVGVKSFNEETDTYLVLAYQIEQAQPGAIGKRFKEQFHAVMLVVCHLLFVWERGVTDTFFDPLEFLRLRISAGYLRLKGFVFLSVSCDQNTCCFCAF
jgi:hypothetical protein